MNREVFSFLGLDEKSIKIYECILPLRDITANTISKKLDLPKSTVNFKCMDLVKKGLLFYHKKNNTSYYSPENPVKIKRILDEEMEKINFIKKNYLEIVPFLVSQFEKYGDKPKIKIFEGVSGIKNMFKDVLDSRSTIYGMTRNEGDMNVEILDWLEHEYIPERIQNKNSAYIIFNDNPTTRTYVKRDKILNRVSLFVPEKQYPFASCCHIYDGKVAFYSYINTDMTGILIENRHIFQTMLTLFKLAWLGARTLSVNEQYKEIDLPV